MRQLCILGFIEIPVPRGSVGRYFNSFDISLLPKLSWLPSVIRDLSIEML